MKTQSTLTFLSLLSATILGFYQSTYAAQHPKMTFLKSWSNTQLKVSSPSLSCHETLSFSSEVLTDPIQSASLLTPLVEPIQKYFADLAILGTTFDFFIMEVEYNQETDELQFISPQKFDIKAIVNKIKGSPVFLRNLKKAISPYKGGQKLVFYIPIEGFILNAKSDALDIRYMAKDESPLDLDVMTFEKSPYDLHPGQTVIYFDKVYKIHTYNGPYEPVQIVGSDNKIITIKFDDIALTWGESNGYKVGELVDYFKEDHFVVGVYHVGANKGKLIIKHVKNSSLLTLTTFTLATYNFKK